MWGWPRGEFICLPVRKQVRASDPREFVMSSRIGTETEVLIPPKEVWTEPHKSNGRFAVGGDRWHFHLKLLLCTGPLEPAEFLGSRPIEHVKLVEVLVETEDRGSLLRRRRHSPGRRPGVRGGRP